jgi:hypothetical protein
MSNSFLFFLVVVEAIIIIWLASKLTQYKRIDQLLAASKGEDANAATTGSLADSTSSATAISTSTHMDETISMDLLNQESGTQVDGQPQENIEEAKLLQWVMARCRYAEFYLEQLDDDYERGQFRHIIDGCVAKARTIVDPFFKANALQSIILLLDQAGWEQYRDSLLAEVGDEIVRERIESELLASQEV